MALFEKLRRKRHSARPLSRTLPLPKHCGIEGWGYGASGVTRMRGAQGWSRCLPTLRPGVVASYRRTAIRSSSFRAALPTRCKRDSIKFPRTRRCSRKRGVSAIHACSLVTQDHIFSWCERKPLDFEASRYYYKIYSSRKVLCVLRSFLFIFFFLFVLEKTCCLWFYAVVTFRTSRCTIRKERVVDDARKNELQLGKFIHDFQRFWWMEHTRCL